MRPLKKFALAAARFGGVNLAMRNATRSRLRILAYHGVDEPKPSLINFDGFHVAPDVFLAQMEHVARCFRPVSLGDAVARLLEGREILPGSVVITFDDGYLNNLTWVSTLLRRMGIPATFFVTTGFIDGTHRPWWYALRSAIAETREARIRYNGDSIVVDSPDAKREAVQRLESKMKSMVSGSRDMALRSILNSCGVENPVTHYPFMTWGDIKGLSEHGFEIGAHTHTHPSLGHEGEDVIRSEVRQSVELIRNRAGNVSPVFSYPYGRPDDVSDAAISVLKSEGLRAAVTTTSGMIDSSADFYRLPRFNVTGNHAGPAFEALVAGTTTTIR